MEIIIRATEKEYQAAGKLAFELSGKPGIVRARVNIVEDCEIIPVHRRPFRKTSRTITEIVQNDYTSFRTDNEMKSQPDSMVRVRQSY